MRDGDEEWLRAVRQGWYFGSEAFEQELLRRRDGALGEHHSGLLRSEGSQARAERIIGEELSRLGWTELDLQVKRKNAPEKLAIAARLRKETTLTVKEIAVRMGLGTSKSANTKLHQFMQDHRSGNGAVVPITTHNTGI